MKKICITYHVSGKYNIFFKYFIKSFDLRFCNECDKTFFVFGDDLDNLKDQIKDCNIKSTIRYFKLDPCSYDADFFKLRKFKFINQAECLFSNFNYIFFANSNLICKEKVTLNELTNDKDQVAVIHPMYLARPELDFKSSLSTNIKSAAYFDPNKLKNYKYYQAAFFGANPYRWLKLTDFVESCRYYDRFMGYEKSAPWHDETYYNKAVSTMIEKEPDKINILKGTDYLCNNWQIEISKYFKKSKMILILKDYFWKYPEKLKELKLD